MNPNLIFVPVLIQVLLTLFVFIRLGQVKEQAVKRGEVDQTRRALHDDAWPDYVLKVNNNIRNQFETPVLFYVLVIGLWSLGAATMAAQLLALVYALLRLAHASVHLGSRLLACFRPVLSPCFYCPGCCCWLLPAHLFRRPAC